MAVKLSHVLERSGTPPWDKERDGFVAYTAALQEKTEETHRARDGSYDSIDNARADTFCISPAKDAGEEDQNEKVARTVVQIPVKLRTGWRYLKRNCL